MTKVIDDYIAELEQNLVDLPAKDREDVVEFYREFLLDGDFVRRSTIEAELGTPKQLAINILADYGNLCCSDRDTAYFGNFIRNFLFTGNFLWLTFCFNKIFV